jgi:hypothetical protein
MGNALPAVYPTLGLDVDKIGRCQNVRNQPTEAVVANEQSGRQRFLR